MSTQDLVDDMSRKDFELPIYGEEEPWRVFEDVYDIGAWPSDAALLEDDREQP